MKSVIRIAKWTNSLGASIRAGYEFDPEKREFYFRVLDWSQCRFYNIKNIISNSTFEWEAPIVINLD